MSKAGKKSRTKQTEESSGKRTSNWIPTIGRIVFYRPLGNEIGEHGGELLPAIIVKIVDPYLVNLKVFSNTNRNAWKENVGCGDNVGQWSWPQY